jgi:catechol 2,3-dioxygenase-like lactoylglutathione lyase family enzyme
MNHVAFNVAPDKIDEYRERLAKAGIDVTPVVNHDDSPNQASKELTPSTFVRSLYFADPDGIMLEFAAWTRELDERDVNCEPTSADAALATAGR